ncbi:MAG: hypothetical protein GC149_10055 [Gammaproteobacteria bacterium]|nr:hypothetical protein [Gammaproteobacteria bacterium]
MTRELTWTGVLWRFVFALIVVMGTYNPSGHSYFHWGIMHIRPFDPVKAVIGILLVIGWVVYLRATLRSLGGVGLILVSALCAALLWLVIDWGLIPRDSIMAVSYSVLTIISIILTVGMIWSHVRRRLSGQVDTDEVEHRE